MSVVNIQGEHFDIMWFFASHFVVIVVEWKGQLKWNVLRKVYECRSHLTRSIDAWWSNSCIVFSRSEDLIENLLFLLSKIYSLLCGAVTQEERQKRKWNINKKIQFQISNWHKNVYEVRQVPVARRSLLLAFVWSVWHSYGIYDAQIHSVTKEKKKEYLRTLLTLFFDVASLHSSMTEF